MCLDEVQAAREEGGVHLSVLPTTGDSGNSTRQGGLPVTEWGERAVHTCLDSGLLSSTLDLKWLKNVM